MSLDRRVRDHVDRVAATDPGQASSGAFGDVTAKATRVRRGRRFGAVGAALACLLIAGLVVLSHALPRPAPPAAPAPTSQVFTSTRYGYSLDYPAGWTARPASVTWEQGTNDNHDAGVSDVLAAPAPGTAAINIASVAIPAGMTDDEWRSQYEPDAASQPLPRCFPTPAHWLPVMVGGHQGGLFGQDYGCSFTEVVVIVDHRAYVFSAYPDPNHVNQEIFDQGLLDQVLGSVTFPAP